MERDITEVRRDPRLVQLARDLPVLRKELIRDYGLIKNAVGTPSYVAYRNARLMYRNVEKALLRISLKEVKEAFFEAIDTREIEAQLRSRAGEISTDGELLAAAMPPPPPYAFEERDRLTLSLFGDLVEGANDLAYRARRCATMKDMATLTFKRETPRQHQVQAGTGNTTALAHDLDTLAVHEDEPDLFPISCPSMVCLFCLGNENITSLSRTYSYARKDSLSRHVERSHLQHIDMLADIRCPHPSCETLCAGHSGFKAHAAMVHNVWHA